MPGQSLYTAAETRELDRIAIEDCGIPGIRLMSRAGHAAFELLLSEWPEPEQLHIYCGTGNNGGDGFIVASLARKRGIPLAAYQIGEPGKVKGDALQARDTALADGVEILPFDKTVTPDSGVIVDAMLGTGLSGDVRGAYCDAIALINASGLPVLAVDIPSGLCSDTGRVLGSAVCADSTISFISNKRGLLTGAAPALTGSRHFADLDVPAETYDRVPAHCFQLELEDELDKLPALARDAHKGMFGHALVVGGGPGMAGAALMAAEAAGRCGAGLVSAATRPEHIAAFVARRPEVMTLAVKNAPDLDPLLQTASAIAVGPGLGRSPWAEQLFNAVAQTDKPLVVDADALNLLAEGRVLEEARRDNWILTPHPGEAARLLQCTSAEIQQDRFAAVAALQEQYGGVVLLKGAGTLVCGGEPVFLCAYGNPGMATGGMGDVLSGVLVSLLAQGLEPLDAACLGACLHAASADLAALDGGRGLLATDLMPYLRELLGD